MVKYKLMWVPSVSPFATIQNIKATINGASVVLASSIALGTFEIAHIFAEGDTVDWYVETVGDNGKTANSLHDSFIALNESTPLAASGLTRLFIEYLP